MVSRVPQIVLFGGSEHARVIIDIARRAGREVIAVVDEDRAKRSFAGVPMVHDAGEAARRHPEADWCVSIGDNYTREAVVERLRAAFGEVRFAAPLLHPGTVIADDVRIGEGTVVMAGAVINPGTTIGRHCIINTRASLDHDNEVDDFCSVAPGVVTGGKVSLGRGSAIGIGACIQHGIRIGTHTVVGAGAVVLADVPDHCVAYGVPCKVVRSRSPSDRYL